MSCDADADFLDDQVYDGMPQQAMQHAFRRAILLVYGGHCSIEGDYWGNLCEAAHILPREVGGPFKVRNGLSLCPNHHKMFDRCAILITSGYDWFNLVRSQEQTVPEKGGNLILPEDDSAWPCPDYLDAGLKWRLERWKLHFETWPFSTMPRTIRGEARHDGDKEKTRMPNVRELLKRSRTPQRRLDEFD